MPRPLFSRISKYGLLKCVFSCGRRPTQVNEWSIFFLFFFVVVVDFHGTNFLEGITLLSEIIVGDQPPCIFISLLEGVTPPSEIIVRDEPLHILSPLGDHTRSLIYVLLFYIYINIFIIQIKGGGGSHPKMKFGGETRQLGL